MTKIVKQIFRIEGMHCSSCAMTIDFDLEDLEGVSSATTHYAREEAEVEFDEEKIDNSRIIEQIAKTGYRAVVK